MIFGTFDEVREKLLCVKAALEDIAQNGFKRFQGDEEWVYHTVEYDECPKCMPHNGASFRGMICSSSFLMYNLWVRRWHG